MSFSLVFSPPEEFSYLMINQLTFTRPCLQDRGPSSWNGDACRQTYHTGQPSHVVVSLPPWERGVALVEPLVREVGGRWEGNETEVSPFPRRQCLGVACGVLGKWQQSAFENPACTCQKFSERINVYSHFYKITRRDCFFRARLRGCSP